MKNTQTFLIDGIGPVVIRQRLNARRMSLSVAITGEVRLTLPRGVSRAQGARFVMSRKEWIENCRQTACRARAEQAALRDAGPQPSRDESERLLRERVDSLARRFGFTVAGVTVRNQRTRWGSCSARNTISLNAALARLPDRLIDYVVLHELVHTRVRNHSPLFWRELETCLHDAHDLRRELRRYHPAPVLAG